MWVSLRASLPQRNNRAKKTAHSFFTSNHDTPPLKSLCKNKHFTHTTYLVLNFRTLKRKSDTDSNSFIPVYLLRHFPTVSMSEPAKPRAMTLNTSATVMFPVVECLTIPYCSQRKCLSLVQHVQAQMSPKLPTSEGLLWRIVRNWLSMNVKQKWTKMNVPKQTNKLKINYPRLKNDQKKLVVWEAHDSCEL